jgi:transketolase N-terminal domain/subunit
MHFHPKDPKNSANDKFILSKGHAAPIYYAAWGEAGNFPMSDLNDFRKITSDFEGHPTPRLEFCDVATGSLGQVSLSLFNFRDLGFHVELLILQNILIRFQINFSA